MIQQWSRVAVVILCWNGRKLLEEFLPSVIQFTPPGTDIIVADNNSADDSVAFVTANFPRVKILQLNKNFGFAAGYNEAIKEIDAEYVLLLNQDVAVTENWLPPLLEVIEQDPNISAVQPRIKSYLQKNYFEYAGAAGGWIDKYGYTFCRGRIFDAIEEDKGQYNDATTIFWASGACLLTRKSVYQQLGGLDADFFAHMEEIDLCWRMNNAGFTLRYCPDATVYHLGGGSLPQGNAFKTYLNYRNNLVMMMKNLPSKNYAGILMMRILLDQVAALRSLLTFHFGDFFAVWKAHLYILSHLAAISKKRAAVDSSFPGSKGVFNGSLVWEFFIRKKKTFSAIVKK
jgi:GT2 family glycosyltransferase